MKTKSLLGAIIVDEAKAVTIIDYCLHGPVQTRPATYRKLAPLRKRKSHAKTTQVTHPPAACPLDDIVLRKREAPVADIPVIHDPLPKNTWRPLPNVRFPAGLCYLATVRGANRQATIDALGLYPSVWALINCPLLEQSGYLLVEQAQGLYHMVTRYTPGAVTLTMARSSWKVGAHIPHRPHPGHNAGYPQRPLTHPGVRPPPPPPQQRVPLPPQSMMAPSIPLGVPAPKLRYKGKPKKNRGPFHPYAPPPPLRNGPTPRQHNGREPSLTP